MNWAAATASRLINSLRVAAVLGAAAGLGRGIAEVFLQGYPMIGYWRSAALTLGRGMLDALLVAISAGILLAVVASLIHLTVRDRDRAAALTLWSVVLSAGIFLAVDAMLRIWNVGSAWHLLEIVRQAVGRSGGSVIQRMIVVAIAYFYLVGILLHLAASLLRRIGILGTPRQPGFGSRVVSWVMALGHGKAVFAASMCVLVIAAAGVASARMSRGSPDPPLVIVSIDTLRADAMGCYGYSRNTTPRLDRFARDAVVFEQALSAAPWTLPSHATMMTSLFPSVHRADTYRSRIPRRVLTLAEVLRERGYDTRAVTSHLLLSRIYGFDQGFYTLEMLGGARASEVTDAALSWVRRRDRRRPFFLFAHYFDPHADYDPPEPFRERFAIPYDGSVTGRREDFIEGISEKKDFEYLRSLYDGEVAYTDREVGRLFDGLRELEIFDSALVVLLADHGEEFGEHFSLEHHTLFEEVIHVPLILKPPAGGGWTPGRVDRVVSLADLAPTVLELIGDPQPAFWQGRSLLPLVNGLSSTQWDDRAFSEQHADVDPHGWQSWSLRTRFQKAIRTDNGEEIVFDFRWDPAELRGFAPADPVSQSLFTTLSDIVSANAGLSEKLLGSPPAHRQRAVLDRETEERLRALGYIR